MKQPLTAEELLTKFADAGIDLTTLEGRRAARELTNKLTGSKWVRSRIIGTLVIFETATGMAFREVTIPS